MSHSLSRQWGPAPTPAAGRRRPGGPRTAAQLAAAAAGFELDTCGLAAAIALALRAAAAASAGTAGSSTNLKSTGRPSRSHQLRLYDSEDSAQGRRALTGKSGKQHWRSLKSQIAAVRPGRRARRSPCCSAAPAAARNSASGIPTPFTSPPPLSYACHMPAIQTPFSSPFSYLCSFCHILVISLPLPSLKKKRYTWYIPISTKPQKDVPNLKKMY